MSNGEDYGRGDMGQIGKYYADDETLVLLYRVDLDSPLAIAERFPATRCTHDYDCCGDWYNPQAGRIIDLDDISNTAIVKVTYYQNV